MNIYLIVYNVRSTHNVGSILRTADGLGVKKVYLCGYTPYPEMQDDERLPHEIAKIHKQIQKTALGAETSVAWQHCKNTDRLIDRLKSRGIIVAGLEQTASSEDISKFKAQKDIALIVGSERGGIPKDILDECDIHLQIPMFGQKDSFNVAVAAAIALYQLRF